MRRKSLRIAGAVLARLNDRGWWYRGMAMGSEGGGWSGLVWCNMVSGARPCARLGLGVTAIIRLPAQATLRASRAGGEVIVETRDGQCSGHDQRGGGTSRSCYFGTTY
jgi:hypothetical protein